MNRQMHLHNVAQRNLMLSLGAILVHLMSYRCKRWAPGEAIEVVTTEVEAGGRLPLWRALWHFPCWFPGVSSGTVVHKPEIMPKGIPRTDRQIARFEALERSL